MLGIEKTRDAHASTRPAEIKRERRHATLPYARKPPQRRGLKQATTFTREYILEVKRLASETSAAGWRALAVLAASHTERPAETKTFKLVKNKWNQTKKKAAGKKIPPNQGYPFGRSFGRLRMYPAGPRDRRAPAPPRKELRRQNKKKKKMGRRVPRGRWSTSFASPGHPAAPVDCSLLQTTG